MFLQLILIPTLPKLNTYINGEWAWVKVDVPDTYSNSLEENSREDLLILFSRY